MHFEIFERGFSRFMVMIPGWGFCSAIFAGLRLPYNYITPVGPVVSDIACELHGFLAQNRIERVSLIGWSMGAYIVDSFSRRWPHMVDRLYLVSTRIAYPRAEIEEQREALYRDRSDVLAGFYRRCFFVQRDHYLRFHTELEKKHTRIWNMQNLLQGLEFLKTCRLDLLSCSATRLHVFHGAKDLIAPLADIPALPPGTEFIVLPGAAHLPFLFPEFEEALNDL